MNTRPDRLVLHFEGPPDALEAVAPAALFRRAETPAVLHVDAGPRAAEASPDASHPLTVERAGGDSVWLGVELSALTPAGEHTGAVVVGDERWPATLSVHPCPAARIWPSQVYKEVGPGDTASMDVVVVNEGNVPLRIPAQRRFGLQKRRSIDRALGQTATDHEATGIARVGRFFDSVAEGYGGVVNVRFEPGPVEVPIDGRVDLRARLVFSDALERDQVYSGSLDLHGAQIIVTVRVARRPPEVVPSTPSASE